MNELKKWRVAAGLTQAELAEKVGITVSMYSMIETGRRRAPYHTAVSLSLITDKAVEWHKIMEIKNHE